MSEKKRHLYAIAVGIDVYQDLSIRKLSFAAADARSFYDSLLRTFPQEDLTANLLLNEEATLKALRTTIGEVVARQAELDDLVVLFVASHGSPETTGTIDDTSRYLILHDTEFDNIFATGLDLEVDFVRLLNRIKSRYIITFIDSCFSGRAGGRTFEGPQLQYLKKTLRGQLVDLKKLELGEGRVVITACDDNEVAWEDSQLGHGIFTHCLLETLQREPTASEPSTISMAALYDEIVGKVKRLSLGRQIPIFNGRDKSIRIPFFQRS